LIPAAAPLDGSGGPERTRFGIGEVLARLRPEFADVTLSKIRFLESAGLVNPARTPAGYRKFSEADIERLRYVLAAQRDRYLPLKVIKEQLAAAEPMLPADQSVELSRDELVAAAGITAGQLDQLESHGLVRGRGRHYDGDALVIARVAGQLAAYGIEARQLRSLRTAAERQIGLVEQAAARLDPHQAAALVALSVSLHAALVRTGLRDRRGA
jgi:DNA-binding transcriptional MerR regulator